jgi:chromosome partitioning protein
LERLKRDHDLILIDSAPQIDTDARLAVRGASLVLVPVQPSPPDVWAAEGTLKLAADERRSAAVVLNRVPATSRLKDTMAAELVRRGHPLLRSAIGNRTGFASSFAEGLGITESSPHSVAARELRALLDELLEMTQ